MKAHKKAAKIALVLILLGVLGVSALAAYQLFMVGIPTEIYKCDCGKHPGE